MADVADDYRKYAKECLVGAVESNSPEIRHALMALAFTWMIAAQLLPSDSINSGTQAPPAMEDHSNPTHLGEVIK